MSPQKNRQRLSRQLFDERLAEAQGRSSGVWRFKELLPPLPTECVVSRAEGNTRQYRHRRLSHYCGIEKVWAKHEGENPTGSFKDRGMTVGTSMAIFFNAKTVVCASTGNTAASMAAYAALGGLKAVVFIPKGEIALGKLSQSLAYGAKTIQINGNFDDAMRIVKELAPKLGFYPLNSLNPFRLEGQKTIVFELLQQRGWQAPDWIVVPGGNLGNTAAFGKALAELKESKLIHRVPRVAVIQAAGSNPFYQSYLTDFKEKITVLAPETLATAIRIGSPINYAKAVKTIQFTKGVVEQVGETEIMDAKAVVDGCGIGCEPASACTVAGIRKLVKKGVIKKDESVVGILTGNLLKDPQATLDYHSKGIPAPSKYANKPLIIAPTISKIRQALK